MQELLPRAGSRHSHVRSLQWHRWKTYKDVAMKGTDGEKFKVHKLKYREEVLHAHAFCVFVPTSNGDIEYVCDDPIIY